MTALAIWAAIQRMGAGAFSALSKLSLWQILLIAALLIAGVQTLRLHAEQRTAGKLQTQVSKLAQELNTISAQASKAEADGKAIAKRLQEKNDEDNRRIAGDANSLRVSGPGKAVCRPAPAAAGGHVPTAPAADAPVAPLPDAGGVELIALPFDDTTRFGESYDQLLAEVQAWRTWHDEVLKAWPKK